jgi:lipopolysaccharide export system permease protein
MAMETGASLMFGSLDNLSQAEWCARDDETATAERTCHRLRTEPYRRWANGFSCLAFALLGAPMAIRLRHSELWASFFVCFLPILLLYYPLLVGCLDRAKNGDLPPSAVWLANVVFASFGVWMLTRVVRR